MLTEYEARKLTDQMERELNATEAVVYICAACLLILFLVVQFGASGPFSSEHIAPDTQFKHQVTSVREHT